MNTHIGGAPGKLKAVGRGEKREPLPYPMCTWVVLRGRVDGASKGAEGDVRVGGYNPYTLYTFMECSKNKEKTLLQKKRKQSKLMTGTVTW